MIPKKLPLVCLVGRTNVGKSALFNRLTKKNLKSLVFDREHVTRDYIDATVEHLGAKFLLIDTGGLLVNDKEKPLDCLAEERAREVLSQADLLLFVCDAKVGLLEKDLQILQSVRRMKKELFLLVNKVDNTDLTFEAGRFSSIGINDVFFTSAVHRRGIDEVLDAVTHKLCGNQLLQIQQEERLKKLQNETLADNVDNSEESLSDDDKALEVNNDFRVAIVGKPNVGKSSLLNLLCNKERSLVSDVAGTTREAIVTTTKYNHNLVELVDTPGMRRQAAVNDPLEELMVKAALASIRTSDIVILMIDGAEGKLCNQELKLLNYALEQKKAVLLLINKIDLLDEQQIAHLDENLKEYDFMLNKILILKTSCLSKKGIGKIWNKLEALRDKISATFDDEALTTLIRTSLTKRPIFKQKQELKIFKVVQMKAKAPTFQLSVRNPLLFSSAELGYVENILRKEYDLRGCPVILRFASKFSNSK